MFSIVARSLRWQVQRSGFYSRGAAASGQYLGIPLGLVHWSPRAVILGIKGRRRGADLVSRLTIRGALPPPLQTFYVVEHN
jgi:hypothetical protein